MQKIHRRGRSHESDSASKPPVVGLTQARGTEAASTSGVHVGLDRFLSAHEVQRIVGVSRSSLWRLQRSGLFPKRRRLSPNRVGWSELEVLRWMTTRPQVD